MYVFIAFKQSDLAAVQAAYGRARALLLTCVPSNFREARDMGMAAVMRDGSTSHATKDYEMWLTRQLTKLVPMELRKWLVVTAQPPKLRAAESVQRLDLSEPSRHRLRQEYGGRDCSIDELVMRTEADLLGIPGMGQISVDEIKEKLAVVGWYLLG